MSKKKQELTRKFSKDEIEEIISGMFTFLNEKQDNIFVNDYLILERKLMFSDVQILKQTDEHFNRSYKDAMKIEKTKLIKFAAADRLNASFVKSVLDEPDHNDWNSNND